MPFHHQTSNVKPLIPAAMVRQFPFLAGARLSPSWAERGPPMRYSIGRSWCWIGGWCAAQLTSADALDAASAVLDVGHQAWSGPLLESGCRVLLLCDPEGARSCLALAAPGARGRWTLSMAFGRSMGPVRGVPLTCLEGAIDTL